MNASLVRIAVVVSALLMVPLLAMRFTDEVSWTLGDFIVAGALLTGAGLGYVFLTRQRPIRSNRTVIGASIGTILVMTWATLAVGLP